MDTLERLQAVHLHHRLLQKHAIATGHGPSNRFLADFLLLLGGSSKEAEEMEMLCGVLMVAIPKMRASSLFQDMTNMETSVTETRSLSALPKIQTLHQVNSTIEDVIPPQRCNDQQGDLPGLWKTERMKGAGEQIVLAADQEHVAIVDKCLGRKPIPVVSLKDMERARSTLEDFCRSYFVFHKMDVSNPAHIFGHLPILVFVESYIYQLDEKNEDYLCPPSPGGLKAGMISGRPQSSLGRNPFAGLQTILNERGLLTKRIEDELNDGLQYWKLEQSLCTALSCMTQVKVEDVMQAIHLKSFDYRVLNLLMYGLRNEPVDDAHCKFLAASELLVEIADDLLEEWQQGIFGIATTSEDQEEDVGKNSFNVLRMFLYIYGPCQAPTMLAKFIGESEDKYQKLLEGLETNIGDLYRRRCEEAVKEGPVPLPVDADDG